MEQFKRDNPQVKSLDWVQRRKELEAKQPPGVDETVMCDADGLLSEGLSSNFVVLQEGTIVTAPDTDV